MPLRPRAAAVLGASLLACGHAPSDPTGVAPPPRVAARRAPPAAPARQGATQAPHHPALNDGGFDLSLRDHDPHDRRIVERIVHARSLPLDRIAPDQRADDAPIVPRSEDDDGRRNQPRFTALGAFTRSGRRYLALVEADASSSHPGAGPDLDREVETPLVFRASTRRADTGRFGKARWRRWQFVDPDEDDDSPRTAEAAGIGSRSLLVVEAADGTPVAVRHVSPDSMGPLAIDAIDCDGTPMLVLTSDHTYAGTSIAVRSELIAFSGGALVHALEVELGRLYMGPPVPENHGPGAGPPGSIRMVGHELRVQSFDDEFSNMGCVAPEIEAGTDHCDGEEQRYRWSPADARLVPTGAPRPIHVVRGKGPRPRTRSR